MAKLKLPSLQHLARIWRSSPTAVEKELLRLARNSPTFSYDILKNFAFDFLNLRIPKDHAIQAIYRKEKRQWVRDKLLEVIPLLHLYCEEIKPQYTQEVAPQYYPLGRNLRIPFSPPLLYGKNNQLIIPWFIFWRANPLSPEQYSLFVTLVAEMLTQDPALESAKFQIIDFSAYSKADARTLQVINTDDIPLLTEARKNEMLSVFAEGFERASATLQKEEQIRNQTHDNRTGDQPPLFDI